MMTAFLVGILCTVDTKFWSVKQSRLSAKKEMKNHFSATVFQQIWTVECASETDELEE